MKYLTGGQKIWIGKGMKESHCGLNITDDEFDKFVRHAVNILKEIKVSYDVLKEMV